MATPGPGLSLIPENGAARTALAQQLACWAKLPNGMTDPRVKFLTCKGIGYYYIPPEVCSAGYGPIPFTSEGNEIVCNPDATHQMDRTIWPEDVLPIDPNTCTTEGIQLAAPVITSVETTDTSASLTWQSVPGAQTYQVRYKTPEAGSWTDGPLVTAPEVTAEVTGLVTGQQYMFQVQAQNPDYMNSVWSGSVLATPGSQPDPLPTPVGLTVGTPTASAVPLTWTPVAGAASYHVQYKLDSDSVWTDMSPDPVNSEVTVTGLDAESVYNFRVKAVAGAGSADSEYSAIVNATTAAAP